MRETHRLKMSDLYDWIRSNIWILSHETLETLQDKSASISAVFNFWYVQSILEQMKSKVVTKNHFNLPTHPFCTRTSHQSTNSWNNDNALYLPYFSLLLRTNYEKRNELQWLGEALSSLITWNIQSKWYFSDESSFLVVNEEDTMFCITPSWSEGTPLCETSLMTYKHYSMKDYFQPSVAMGKPLVLLGLYFLEKTNKQTIGLIIFKDLNISGFYVTTFGLPFVQWLHYSTSLEEWGN